MMFMAWLLRYMARSKGVDNFVISVRIQQESQHGLSISRSSLSCEIPVTLTSSACSKGDRVLKYNPLFPSMAHLSTFV